MVSRIKAAAKCFPEKFSEAWLSCLLVMVQGDILALSLKHAFIASKTGFLAGLGCAFMTLLLKKPTEAQNLVAIGAFTGLADYVVHPTHFGPHWAEAAVTALGAVGIAYIVGKVRVRK